MSDSNEPSSTEKVPAKANTCMRCGEIGPHYVPPGFGSSGFFMCDPDDKPHDSSQDRVRIRPDGSIEKWPFS